MKTSDFNYTLDPSLIAQHPTPNREDCRLLVLDKDTGEMTHDQFYHLKDYLKPGDLLIVNDTRVIPARLYGHREGREERIETLLLKRIRDDRWECLVKPGKKMKIDTEIVYSAELRAQVVDILDGGQRVLDFSYEGVWEEILDRVGSMPTPPYITEELQNPDDYQTVYAKVDGSAAAPTAGLHFTEAMLEDLERSGIAIGKLTLHVGLGTFRPVSEENIEEHPMHAEFYILPQETVDLIERTKAAGGRVISVGTTSTRTLETVAQKFGHLEADSGWTDIFIYPGYTYRAIDGIITNFHLPESTLIMMIAALVGRERILHAYEVANRLRYRFFSFGDAMLILKRDDAISRNADQGVVRDVQAFFDGEHDPVDLQALGVSTEGDGCAQ
ncbi:MAG: tRNA preQ1(34) S-adenosylmethionine ribosyltransferase-isomerase QueA [Peptoniphilaceae bacterium]|nr:tRNA preQ1(34) S-adenosylmethionine ribosyltransferase-isomerase QueA [Peptoniphilaceae bacterium]MDY6086000.1 tRNA preQ1(34) S-adenosylmethionine ribosyltransferase-isomerase QueA [Peptoniphilaceae bacterium]